MVNLNNWWQVIAMWDAAECEAAKARIPFTYSKGLMARAWTRGN